MSFYIDPLELSFEEAILVMSQLQEYFFDCSNPEDERDQCRVIFYELAFFFKDDIEKEISKEPHKFNIMAPAGGPYSIPKEMPIKIKPWLGTVYEAFFGEYVGYIHIWSIKCGINNLDLLMK